MTGTIRKIPGISGQHIILCLWMTVLLVTNSIVPLYHLVSAAHSHRFNYDTAQFEDVTVEQSLHRSGDSSEKNGDSGIAVPSNKHLSFSSCATSNLFLVTFSVPAVATYSPDSFLFTTTEIRPAQSYRFSSKIFLTAPKQSPPNTFIG